MPPPSNYRLTSIIMGVVRSLPFQMRKKPETESEYAMFITKKVAFAPNVAAGLSAAVALPVSRRDGAGSQRCPDRAQASRLRLLSERRHHGQWIPKTAGAGFEFTPTLAPLEPYQRPVGGHRQSRPRRYHDRRSCRGRRRMADRRLREEDRSRRCARRAHDRPVDREADRDRRRLFRRSNSPPKISPATSAGARRASAAPT